MHIVVSHPNADLDAFASVIAASRLYPGSVPVRSVMLSPVVRAFLALHKDRFPTTRSDEVDAESVTRMTVVDVRVRGRLKEQAAVLERMDRGEVAVEIFDHHPATSDDIHCAAEVVEPVGACVTLLVERLRAAGHCPDPVEATLYALGIYADTGSLAFTGTTGRDAAAVAWLLEQGADLRLMGRYLHRDLSPEQRRTMVSLLGTIETTEVSGIEIGTVIHPLTEKVNGLGEVVSRVQNIEGVDALVGFFVSRGGRIDIIARSRVAWVDVGDLLGRLADGGGHAAAAAARARAEESSPEALRERLLTLLNADPPRPRRVEDLMTSPVRCVHPDLPLHALRDNLAEWRHTGVPVSSDGRLVGVISRRDVEKAERDDALDEPVGGRMSTHVHSIGPEDALEQALELITTRDVGRLPVVRDGAIIGILTRTDLLRCMYGKAG
ncbi:MAG: CBS domain-containing protein [Deltaproteobacteria bacterium]|nr:MAG: CBS domain-containing protein [Deltaproteobacteria bacterium]